MYWIAALALLSALALMRLGALSVWVSVLSTALTLIGAMAVAAVASLTAWALLRRFRRA
jgi:hypothetical protein